MSTYFIRFEPSKDEAKANLKAAKKNANGMPVAFEAEAMFSEQDKKRGIDAAMDVYLAHGDPDTWFTVYSGQQLGKWNGIGKIIFDPASIVACFSRDQVLGQRKGGQTPENAVAEPVRRLPKRGYLKTVENNDFDGYSRELPPIHQQVVSNVTVTIPDDQIISLVERYNAESKRSRKRTFKHRAIRAASVAGFYIASLLGMHIYDINSAAAIINAQAAPSAASAPLVGYPESYVVKRPNLATPIHLSWINQTNTSVEIGYTQVPGVTGYQIWAQNMFGKPFLFYTTPSNLGWRADRLTIKSSYVYPRTYAVRAFWRFGGKTYFGRISNSFTAQGFAAWNTIWNLDRQSVVKISDQTFTVGSLGSGFFVPGGDIVTCWHVVRYGGLIRYRVSGGSWHFARVVAHSVADDLALLKPTFAAPKPGLTGGISFPLKVGVPVADMGFPLGQHLLMVSGGKIRSMNDTIDVSGYGVMHNMFKADVSGYEGDSGSPIFDHWGGVVGVLEDGSGITHFNLQTGAAQSGIISLSTLASFLVSADPSQATDFSSYTGSGA